MVDPDVHEDSNFMNQTTSCVSDSNFMNQTSVLSHICST